MTTPIFLLLAAAGLCFAAVACVRAARAERIQADSMYRVFEDEARREELRAR